MLDRIIGFKLSKLLQNKIRSKSAGRVQSVALKLIVERENEIKAFKSEEYWSVHANLKKGTQVYVCGDVYADVFQKDDGSHIPSVSLTVSRIELLGKAEKKESGDGTASGQPQ